MEFSCGDGYFVLWEITHSAEANMSHSWNCKFVFTALLVTAAGVSHVLSASDATNVTNRPAAETLIRQALAKPLELKYDKLPLGKVAENLQKKLGVPVQLDVKPLADDGIKVNTPVTFASSHVSAKATLESMLRELELTSVIRDEVLLITTPEEADNFVEVRVYEVSDLVRTPDDKSSDGVPNFDSVADIIATSINPTGWGACSGPPPIYPLTIPGVDMIVFGQTQAAHEEVEALLAQLRAVRHMSKGSRSESLKLPLQGTTSPLVAETPLCPPVAPAMAAIRRASSSRST